MLYSLEDVTRLKIKETTDKYTEGMKRGNEQQEWRDKMRDRKRERLKYLARIRGREGGRGDKRISAWKKNPRNKMKEMEAELSR